MARILASVVKAALGAALVVGGVVGVVYISAELQRQGSLESNQPSIDYNCNLPGTGHPWLRQDLSYTVQFTTSAVFVSTVPNVSPWAAFLPIPIAGDGTALSMDDVYRRLCLVHPQLGGSGLTRVSTAEAKQVVCGGQDQCLLRKCDDFPDLYTDKIALTGNEARMCLEPVRMYWLPPIPQDLRDALATAAAREQTPTPSPTPTATPAASPETRSYMVTVSGYEVVDINRPDNAHASVTASARFTYQLKGKFTIIQDRRLWKLSSAKLTSADVQVTVSLSPSECWTQSKPITRYFARLRQSTGLGGLVNSHGDGSWEVQLIWSHLRPGARVDAVVSADAQCGGSGQSVPYDFESSLFFNWLNAELLEVQGHDRLETTGGVSNRGKRVVDYTITVVRRK